MAEDIHEVTCLVKETREVLGLALTLQNLNKKFAKQKCILQFIGKEEKRNRKRLLGIEKRLQKTFDHIEHQKSKAIDDDANFFTQNTEMESSPSPKAVNKD